MYVHGYFFVRKILLILDDDESNKIRVAAYSNQALCYQKTNDHFEGRNAVSETKKSILKTEQILNKILMCFVFYSVMKL